MTRASLDLQGDEDLEDAIEATFEVGFTNDELRGMVTVGAIHDVLCAKIPERPGACETSMSFYRLRRALRATGLEAPITPETTLPQSFHEQPAASLRRLSTMSGLRLPQADVGPLMYASWLTGLVAATLGASALVLKVPGTIWMAGAVAVITVGLAVLDPGRLPASIRTVGDLARRSVPLNYAALVREGARSDAEAIWVVLREAVAHVAEVPIEEIGRETRIYPAQKSGGQA